MYIIEHGYLGLMWTGQNINNLKNNLGIKSHNKYVSKLLNPNNNHGNKHFWSYIKSKKKNQSGMPSLELHHQTFSDSQSKANILNDQFSSVFTTSSPDDCARSLDGVPYPTVPPIDVDVDGVTRLLHNLQPHKAPSPA